MLELNHLSYSSISLFLNCPEHWRRKYLEGESVPSTPALLFGSAFHNAVEFHLAQRDRPLTEIWSETWAEAVKENPDCEWAAETPEEHYNAGIRLLTTPDVMDMLDRIRLKVDDDGPMIERKLTLTVPGVPVPIVGYMDIMTADGVPGDFKTSTTQWTQDRARNELQPAFYLAALNQAGIDVPGLTFRHYVVTKTKQPRAQVIEHRRTWDEIFWLFDLIRRVWQAIEAGAFPYGPNSWLCGPKYCPFWSTCRGKGV